MFHLIPASLYDIYLMLYVQCLTPDGEWRDRLKHVECCSKIKWIWDIVHLVGFTIEIYYDAVLQTSNFAAIFETFGIKWHLYQMIDLVGTSVLIVIYFLFNTVL
jgi:hypothetical protein